MLDPHGNQFHATTTHVDSTGMPVAFYRGPGAPAEGLSTYPTPCCGAAASIDDGPMYCKACYRAVPWSYGGVPKEPFTQLGQGCLEA